MKTAITYLYKSSREEIHEVREKREYRKTLMLDPNYTPRRSVLMQKYRSRRESMGRALSIFGRPAGIRDSFLDNSVPDIPGRYQRAKSMDHLDRLDEMDDIHELKMPERVHVQAKKSSRMTMIPDRLPAKERDKKNSRMTMV